MMQSSEYNTDIPDKYNYLESSIISAAIFKYCLIPMYSLFSGDLHL